MRAEGVVDILIEQQYVRDLAVEARKSLVRLAGAPRNAHPVREGAGGHLSARVVPSVVGHDDDVSGERLDVDGG